MLPFLSSRSGSKSQDEEGQEESLAVASKSTVSSFPSSSSSPAPSSHAAQRKKPQEIKVEEAAQEPKGDGADEVGTGELRLSNLVVEQAQDQNNDDDEGDGFLTPASRASDEVRSPSHQVEERGHQGDRGSEVKKEKFELKLV